MLSDDLAILINGLPGAGKSTLATDLASELRLPEAQQRFGERHRHEVHEDGSRAGDWESWRRARPLFTDHLAVDTSRPVAVIDVAQRVRAAAPCPPALR